MRFQHTFYFRFCSVFVPFFCRRMCYDGSVKI
nr:MAG TPA: hypothetical protein [Caudoviricetes sp.]